MKPQVVIIHISFILFFFCAVQCVIQSGTSCISETQQPPEEIPKNTWLNSALSEPTYSQCYSMSFSQNIQSYFISVSIKAAPNNSSNPNMCVSLQNGDAEVLTVCENETNDSSDCIGGTGSQTVFSSPDNFLNVWCKDQTGENPCGGSLGYQIYWNSYEGSMSDNPSSCPNAPPQDSADGDESDDDGSIWPTLIVLFALIAIILIAVGAGLFWVSRNKVQTARWLLKVKSFFSDS